MRRQLIRYSAVALLTVLAALSAGSVLAQSNKRNDLGSAMRVIRPMMRDDPVRAIGMLKQLQQQYPEHTRIYLMLGDTYQVLGDIDAARDAYQQCLRVDPNNYQAGAALGTLLYKEGDPAAGQRVFDDLLRRTDYAIGSYRAIGNLLSQAGFHDQALAMYEDGRSRNNNSYIMSLDIAYLHTTLGNYEEAVYGYLFVLEHNPKQHRLAQQKILEMVRQHDDISDGLLAIVREDAERDAPFRRYVMAVLAIAYLDRSMFESALDMALQADEQGTSDGQVIYSLGERVVTEYHSQPVGINARYFDVGVRALEAFVDAYPQSPQIPSARLMLTDLWLDRASGKVPGSMVPVQDAIDKSLVTFDWLIDTYPGSEFAEQAYLRKGDLLFRVQHDTEGALVVYQEGSRRSRFYPAEFAEHLGRVYLVTEDYDSAERHFTRLIGSNNNDLQDTGNYYAGMLLGFQGEYAAARDTLTALAEKNPGSSFTNDAIDLAWIIEEGLQGEIKVLNSYINAMKSEIAGDTLQVLSYLSIILQEPPETPLRRRALMQLGDAYHTAGRDRAAIRTFELYLADYPVDIERPDVVRKIGFVYEHGMNNVDLALDTYEKILVMYPHYIFLDEVRGDVMRLREEIERIGELQ